MRPGTRLLCEEPLVPGRSPKASRLFPPQVAYFYAAPLAQFCSALDTALKDGNNYEPDGQITLCRRVSISRRLDAIVLSKA